MMVLKPPPRFIFDRLRADPIPSTVPASLPVLFFGDPFTSAVATVGINPSRQEYLSPNGQELDGIQRRFETLSSLGASSRSSLDDVQAINAIERMRRYFDPDRPVYAWFNGLSRLVQGMGASFRDRSAAHLDLVQEATDPVWSQLIRADRVQAKAVLHRDLPFLQKQIEEFAFRTIVCTSARVYQEVSQMLRVRLIKCGTLARLSWKVATAELSRGLIGIVGWNIPLAQPTGLNRDGQQHLGKLLASQLTQAGINLR
jgi:hypothetical protein